MLLSCLCTKVVPGVLKPTMRAQTEEADGMEEEVALGRMERNQRKEGWMDRWMDRRKEGYTSEGR